MDRDLIEFWETRVALPRITGLQFLYALNTVERIFTANVLKDTFHEGAPQVTRNDYRISLAIKCPYPFNESVQDLTSQTNEGWSRLSYLSSGILQEANAPEMADQ